MKENRYFTKFEACLLSFSLIFILVSFLIFDRERNFLALAASLIGATALIFNAKGNPVGPALMIGFCALYGIISWSFAYYGEVITYVGMSCPMAIFSLVAWLRNPFRGKKSEVTVNRISPRELLALIGLAIAVTVIFYFVLKTLGTKNLWPSTFSVTTSFGAAYLSARRSPYFALVYALNDIVLMVLWVLACLTDISYLSVVICFAVFLVNDLYSFINWNRMEKRQSAIATRITATKQ